MCCSLVVFNSIEVRFLMALPENKKQLHHCTSAIRNRTSILLNTTSEHVWPVIYIHSRGLLVPYRLATPLNSLTHCLSPQTLLPPTLSLFGYELYLFWIRTDDFRAQFPHPPTGKISDRRSRGKRLVVLDTSEQVRQTRRLTRPR